MPRSLRGTRAEPPRWMRHSSSGGPRREHLCRSLLSPWLCPRYWSGIKRQGSKIATLTRLRFFQPQDFDSFAAPTGIGAANKSQPHVGSGRKVRPSAVPVADDRRSPRSTAILSLMPQCPLGDVETAAGAAGPLKISFVWCKSWRTASCLLHAAN